MAETVPVETQGVPEIRVELRQAVRDLQERGLIQGAVWVAEQLAGLPESVEDATAPPQQLPSASTARTNHETDVYFMAKAYFDVKEYRRAAAELDKLTEPDSRSQFLKFYALYLSGEKRKEEERVETSGALAQNTVANEELEGLHARLLAATDARPDTHLLHLLAVVRADLGRSTEAISAAVAAIAISPCNWPAWQVLLQLCTEWESVSELALPSHWMRDIFLATLAIELQWNGEGLARLQSLAELLPQSHTIILQAAMAHYNLRNFDESQGLFEELLARDPHRLEGLDVYSNILYVKEQYAPLSHLAHRVSLTDKYRPETCCIIGNYYSLKGDHERAVLYFHRALKLAPTYLSAWTLMGHELVEMKNPAAAINAYRRAVDLNPRDYRAWYGLGQTYEMMAMPYYALYYFRRATQLRPSDARMWVAMGQCYEHDQLQEFEAAVSCYRRAVSNSDREGIALHKLAMCHARLGQREEAAHYFTQNLQAIDADNSSGQDAVDAMLYLAQYYHDKEMRPEVETYCMRLQDYGGVAKDRARALMSSFPLDSFLLTGAAAGGPSALEDGQDATPPVTADVSEDAPA